MKNEAQLKELVKEKYSEIATQSKETNVSSCCGATGCGSNDVYNIMVKFRWFRVQFTSNKYCPSMHLHILDECLSIEKNINKYCYYTLLFNSFYFLF